MCVSCILQRNLDVNLTVKRRLIERGVFWTRICCVNHTPSRGLGQEVVGGEAPGMYGEQKTKEQTIFARNK